MGGGAGEEFVDIRILGTTQADKADARVGQKLSRITTAAVRGGEDERGGAAQGFDQNEGQLALNDGFAFAIRNGRRRVRAEVCRVHAVVLFAPLSVASIFTPVYELCVTVQPPFTRIMLGVTG